MISGPVMIQVLEGEGAIAKNRDLMGATDPKKADKGTHPRRLRRQHRRQRGARLRRAGDGRGRDRVLLPRHERLQPLTRRVARGPPRRMGAGQSARLRPRRAGGLLRRPGREALPRACSCSAGSTRRARRDFDSMSDLAKSLRDKLAGVAEVRALPLLSASMCRPTARSSGCSTSAAAMRSRPSSSPRTTAARCACRRRPAARSAAASARPATRASAAT